MDCGFLIGPLGLFVTATIPTSIVNTSLLGPSISKTLKKATLTIQDVLNDEFLHQKIASFTRSLKMCTNNEQSVKFLLKRAKFQLLLRNAKESKADLEAALKLDTTNSEVHFFMGVAQRLMGNYNQAIICFTQALFTHKDSNNLVPQSPRTRNNNMKRLFQYFAGTTKFTNCDILDMSKGLDPLNKSSDMYEIMKEQSAIVSKSFIFNNRGHCHLLMRNYDHAWKDFYDAQKDPSLVNYIIVYNQAMTKFHMRHYKESYLLFDTIIKEYPECTDNFILSLIHCYRSRIQEILGNTKKALEYCKVAQQMNPSIPMHIFYYRCIPKQQLLNILSYLSVKEKVQLALVNRDFKSLCYDPHLWNVLHLVQENDAQKRQATMELLMNDKRFCKMETVILDKTNISHDMYPDSVFEPVKHVICKYPADYEDYSSLLLRCPKVHHLCFDSYSQVQDLSIDYDVECYQLLHCTCTAQQVHEMLNHSKKPKTFLLPKAQFQHNQVEWLQARHTGTIFKLI